MRVGPRSTRAVAATGPIVSLSVSLVDVFGGARDGGKLPSAVGELCLARLRRGISRSKRETPCVSEADVPGADEEKRPACAKAVYVRHIYSWLIVFPDLLQTGELQRESEREVSEVRENNAAFCRSRRSRIVYVQPSRRKRESSARGSGTWKSCMLKTGEDR